MKPECNLWISDRKSLCACANISTHSDR